MTEAMPETVPEVYVYTDREGLEHAVFLGDIGRAWFHQGIPSWKCEAGQRASFDRLQAGDTPAEAYEVALRVIAAGPQMSDLFNARVETAIWAAVSAHLGQRDKAGQPYILHPLRVMLRGRNDDERIVGVLHDVLEDTACGWVVNDLTGEQRAAILALTRRQGEDYGAYLARLKPNPLARQVKLYDLADNLDETRRAAISSSLVDRYARARTYLSTWEPPGGSPVAVQHAMETGGAAADNPAE
jgi:hypothetical protein